MIDINSTPIASLLAEGISYVNMQIYVVIMIALVVIMTVLDLLHKKSSIYFLEHQQNLRRIYLLVMRHVHWVKKKIDLKY